MTDQKTTKPKPEKVIEKPVTNPESKNNLQAWTNAIMAASTVIIAFVTCYYVKLTHDLVKVTSTQLAVVQDPVLSINPERSVEGKIGSFSLNISNSGVSDVKSVEIYQDCFVALKTSDGQLTFYQFGILSSEPNVRLDRVSIGASRSFAVDFSKAHDEMNRFYNSDIKGARMKILRLTAKYTRTSDGKPFTLCKFYVIAGHGDALLDYDLRGLDVTQGISLQEIKSALGSRSQP